MLIAATGQLEHQFPPTMFGAPRPMLPPSPQQFPRYQLPNTQMPITNSIYDMKGPVNHQGPPPPLPLPHKRPGSSMSISSMLGSEPERIHHELPPQVQNHYQSRVGSTNGPVMHGNPMMSPPNQFSRPGMSEYPYQMSKTPDRLDYAFGGNRQRSASSGTSMTLNRPFYEPQDRFARPPTTQAYAVPPFNNGAASREEQDERQRRTSLSGILQRPSSQPQSSIPPPQPLRVFDPLPPQRPNWYADPPPPAHEPLRPNGFHGSYDTKPPGIRDAPRTIPTSQPSPAVLPPQPPSPEVPRISNGTFNRGLAGLLNGTSSQQSDPAIAASHNMMRQDSSQSQSDRSIYGDRNRFRHFSPFVAGPHMPASQDERKNSDEISHKAIVGIGLENRRGRYSPVPQAVQGAQAHTPVPHSGPKSDQGKVFSGIGGGLVSSTTPVPASASPFKKDEALGRPADALKAGRSTSNIGKRSRKLEDEDGEPESKKSTSKKRTKYQNSYKADLEEMATSSLPRRGTPQGGRTASSNAANATSLGRYDTAPIFKPKKMVKVGSIISQTLRKPRRHLGTFNYDPDILVSEAAIPSDAEHDIMIKPKLLPSFSEVEDLNCTYTIYVSKTWLQERERRLICSTRNLWGTAIYTDDTDPVAAAMHMGWIKPAFQNIDETLLQKITQDQNPKVDVIKDLKPPPQPLEISKGRDFKITCVVMPSLEKYEETARFGIRSRAWPNLAEGAPHDGASFSILKVETVELGPEERRMGRTGQSRRARLKEQLMQREKAKRTEKERVAKLTQKLKERAEKQKQDEAEKQKQNAKPPSPLANEVAMEDEPTRPVSMEITTSAALSTPAAADEWIKQLATAAA